MRRRPEILVQTASPALPAPSIPRVQEVASAWARSGRTHPTLKELGDGALQLLQVGQAVPRGRFPEQAKGGAPAFLVDAGLVPISVGNAMEQREVRGAERHVSGQNVW